jgi:pimeloyl-ACP methyl ester carboxylesterase
MDFSILWAEVQARVSRFTRVCSYDRAGLGWSDAGVTPRSSDVAIKELEQVLAAAGVSPPYVMVGHSYGGLIARRFSEAHRERVVGLVLVDAAHDEQLRRIPSLAAARTTTLRQLRRYRAVLASSDYFRGAAAELEVMEESFAAPASSPAPLGDTPVIVVSRGLSDTLPGTSHSAEEAEWRALQRDLLALSRQSVHVIAERSGHDVHVHQPEVVVGAIKWVQDRRR